MERNRKNSLRTISQEDSIRIANEREILMAMEKEALLKNIVFPQEPSTDGYYHLMLPDDSRKNGRRHIKARSVEDLREKAYRHILGLHGNPQVKRTFAEVYAMSQEELLKYVKGEDKLVSTRNTITRHRQTYDRFFKGTDFELRSIDQIDKRQIEDVILMNLKRFDLRNTAFVSMTTVLRTAFSYAFEHEWISDNPFVRINLKDSRFRNMLVEAVPLEERSYTDEEMRLIMNELHRVQKKKPDYLPAYALELQIICGLRRAEVCGLKFSDIQTDRKSGEPCLMIRRELLVIKKSEDNPKTKSILAEHTKTRKDRKLPIFDDLEDIIQRIIAVHRRYSLHSEFLFPRKEPVPGEPKCISINTVYHFYHRMCERQGIELQADAIRGPHAFRRNKADEIENSAGGSPELASRLLGNTPRVLKQNYYDGVDMSTAKDVLNNRSRSDRRAGNAPVLPVMQTGPEAVCSR